MKTPHESLAQFPVIISLPVQWGDQDALSHVNNIIYMRWTESSRIAYLSRTGIWDGIATATTGPILAAISCDFRLPVTFPDMVYAGARITAMGNSSFKMEHRIVSANQEAIAADLDSTLVWFDYRAGKPLALPPEVRKAIEELEGRPLPSFTRNSK